MEHNMNEWDAELEDIIRDMNAASEKLNGTCAINYALDEEFPKGYFELSTDGMWDNWELPELKIRGVHCAFLDHAARLLDLVNAYRLARPDHNVNDGVLLTVEGEKLNLKLVDGFLQLEPGMEDIPYCECCEMNEHIEQ
jgi:hypothetical protein